MRAAQVHTCNEDYCLKLMRDGTRKCKRRAPFPLADADWVDEEGNWGPQRTYGYLNNWCPPLVGLLRANHDIKNSSALLAHALYHHERSDAYRGDLLERNRLLLFRCWNALNRQSELSAQQVVMYLMGWGDSAKNSPSSSDSTH